MIARTRAVAKLYSEQILNEQRYDSTVEKAYKTSFAASAVRQPALRRVPGAASGRQTGVISVKMGRGGGDSSVGRTESARERS